MPPGALLLQQVGPVQIVPGQALALLRGQAVGKLVLVWRPVLRSGSPWGPAQGRVQQLRFEVLLLWRPEALQGQAGGPRVSVQVLRRSAAWVAVTLALGRALRPLPVLARAGTAQAVALQQRYSRTRTGHLEPTMSIAVPGWAAAPDLRSGLVVVLST